MEHISKALIQFVGKTINIPHVKESHHLILAMAVADS
jgi:hypothetical protein